MLLWLRKDGRYFKWARSQANPGASTRELPESHVAAASVVLNAGALPVDLLLDREGPRVSIAVAAFIEVAGLSLLTAWTRRSLTRLYQLTS